MLSVDMDNGVSASAVDLPLPKLELEVGRRRHRRITGPASVLLFVCLFLPAVEGCNEPVYPITMPWFMHPYVYGIVFALGAATYTARGLRYTITALRVLAWLTLLGGAFLVVALTPIGIVEMCAGGFMLAIIGRQGHSERRVAVSAIAMGMVSVLWFGLWASTGDALIGVYLSLLGATGLLVGGLVWLGETALAPSIVLPRALARDRE